MRKFYRNRRHAASSEVRRHVARSEVTSVSRLRLDRVRIRLSATNAVPVRL